MIFFRFQGMSYLDEYDINCDSDSSFYYSTRKIKYLEENVGSLEVQLTPHEEAAIRKAVDNAEVHGDRYPEAMAYGLFADTPMP